MADGEVTRRLAAIVAADMVGYSRLMEQDEAGVLARQKSHRNDIIDPKVSEHGGRIVKTTGDGLLIEFASAINAVLCTVDIQRAMVERESEVPEDQRIAYRAGINLGDIIYDDGDIFGDGINVAARLEALAEPGGICISDVVFKNVRGKLDLGFADLGPQQVKNITEPILTYQVLLDAADIGKFTTIKPAATRRWRPTLVVPIAASLLAVLAIVFWQSMSVDRPGLSSLLILPVTGEIDTEDGELLLDGVTDDLIASFSKLTGIAVAPRATTLRYKTTPLPAETVAKRHDVEYVLMPRIALDGDAIRLTMSLWQSSSGNVIWQESFERDNKAIFKLLAAAKFQAAAAMQIAVSETERAEILRVRSQSFKAYAHYLRAERLRQTRWFSSYREALKNYDTAIQHDPDYTDALAGIVRASFLIWQQTWNSAVLASKARERLDSALKRALEKEPEHPIALAYRARLRLEDGDQDTALAWARSAVFLNSESSQLRLALAIVLFASGKVEEAREELTRAMERSPKPTTDLLREVAYYRLLLGEIDMARALLERARASGAPNSVTSMLLANAYARLDKPDLAKIELKKLEDMWPWMNLRWMRPIWAHFKNRKLVQDYADGYLKAGMPEWPFNADKGRDKQRLRNNDLQKHLKEKSFKKVGKNPYGAEIVSTLTKEGAYATEIPEWKWTFEGRWYIKKDTICYEIPNVHMGRPFCNILYRDEERWAKGDAGYVELSNWGDFKYTVEPLRAE